MHSAWVDAEHNVDPAVREGTHAAPSQSHMLALGRSRQRALASSSMHRSSPASPAPGSRHTHSELLLQLDWFPSKAAHATARHSGGATASNQSQPASTHAFAEMCCPHADGGLCQMHPGLPSQFVCPVNAAQVAERHAPGGTDEYQLHPALVHAAWVKFAPQVEPSHCVCVVALLHCMPMLGQHDAPPGAPGFHAQPVGSYSSSRSSLPAGTCSAPVVSLPLHSSAV